MSLYSIDIDWGDSPFISKEKHEKWFLDIADFVMNELNLDESVELSVKICNNTFIQELNREYRGKDSPTDVLSFAMNEGEDFFGEDNILGDIVIAPEVIAVQAEEIGHSIEREFAYIFIHGLLHLLGYDHIDDEERIEMEQTASKLIDKVISAGILGRE